MDQTGVFGGKGVEMGEASTTGVASIRVLIAIGVWVELTCKVIAATEPVRFWLMVWVAGPRLLGRLQAERMVISVRDIDRSLNVFNLAF